jgi:Family of unknown function (DUF6308)
MAQFGRLQLPDVLLNEEYAQGLIHDYFRRDSAGYMYSGAMFDTYPADPASGIAASSGPADKITDSDLVALSLLGIRVTGYQALIITQDRQKEIAALLAGIPPDAHIEGEASETLLAPECSAWKLWEILRGIKDRTKESRFGAVAAGKLLARKRPNLIPIEDSLIAAVFSRKSPDQDEHWWDDMRSAALDPSPAANGSTLWCYLARLRDQTGQDHLPVLRVLDIIGWMHARDPESRA